MSVNIVRQDLEDAAHALASLLADEKMLEAIDQAGSLMAAAEKAGGAVYSCGNGGSLCDAMHFAEELTGRFRSNREPLRAVAIADPAHLSCVSNDFGYEHVFSRWVEAFARPGDVLLAISTSGTSRNVLAALEAAHRKGAKVVGLTGKADSPLAREADIAIVTPGGTKWSDRVQELHIKVIHILIELIERELAPQNYSEP